MTEEELVQRIRAYRKSQQPIELLTILPMVVVWLGGSWLIMEEAILADRSYGTKSDVMLGLMLLMLLVEVVVMSMSWRKSAFRTHGLLCPQCDGRILNFWNPRKVLETGTCHHCGHTLVDAKNP
jgi:hypothetical protein